MENINIEERLAKILSGNASSEEQAWFESWLTADADNQKLFEDFEHVWAMSQRDTNLFDVDEAWQKVQTQIEGHETGNFKFTVFYKVAALLAVVVGLFWLMNALKPKQSVIIANQLELRADSMMLAHLDDGSVVTLKKGALLQYPDTFMSNTRQVYLEGEAYFEVSANPENPFEIETPYAFVKVVGTKFNVLVIDSLKTVEVFVEEGKVGVYRKNDRNNVTYLEPGQFALLGDSTPTRVSDDAPPNVVAWKNRRIKFSNASLEEVFATLEDVYGIHVQVKSSALLACQFTGRFNNKSWKKVMKQLAFTYNFEYRANKNLVVVEGGDACN